MQKSVTEDRYRYIGGSDLSAIMGISPFTTRMDMLLYKAQLKENDFQGNSYTEYGNEMESKIRDYINEELGFEFWEDRKIVPADVIDWRYHADGVDADQEMVLEIKTTSEIKDDVKDYKNYLVQLLMGMVMYDYECGMLAVYERPEDMSTEFDKSRLHTYMIHFEDYLDLWDEVKEALNAFTKDLAYIKENPLAEEEELPSRNAIEEVVKQMVLVGGLELPVEWLLENEKTLTEQIKGIKTTLTRQMEEHHIKSSEVKDMKITFVPQGEDTIKEKFDEKKFKEDNPELYEKYLTTKTQKGKSAYVLIKHRN